MEPKSRACDLCGQVRPISHVLLTGRDFETDATGAACVVIRPGELDFICGQCAERLSAGLVNSRVFVEREALILPDDLVIPRQETGDGCVQMSATDVFIVGEFGEEFRECMRSNWQLLARGDGYIDRRDLAALYADFIGFAGKRSWFLDRMLKRTVIHTD